MEAPAAAIQTAHERERIRERIGYYTRVLLGAVAVLALLIGWGSSQIVVWESGGRFSILFWPGVLCMAGDVIFCARLAVVINRLLEQLRGNRNAG